MESQELYFISTDLTGSVHDKIVSERPKMVV